jgi:hypothetical protein
MKHLGLVAAHFGLYLLLPMLCLSCTSGPQYSVLILPSYLQTRRDAIEVWIKEDARENRLPPDVLNVSYSCLIGETYTPLDSRKRIRSLSEGAIPVHYLIRVGQVPKEEDLNIVGVSKILWMRNNQVAYGCEFLKWNSDSKAYDLLAAEDNFPLTPSPASEP